MNATNTISELDIEKMSVNEREDLGRKLINETIKALASNTYNKARYALKIFYHNSEKCSHCVMGVICEEAGKLGINMNITVDVWVLAGYDKVSFDGDSGDLPKILRNLLCTDKLISASEPSQTGYRAKTTLSSINDESDYSFGDIALLLNDWKHIFFPSLFVYDKEIVSRFEWRLGARRFCRDGTVLWGVY